MSKASAFINGFKTNQPLLSVNKELICIFLYQFHLHQGKNVFTDPSTNYLFPRLV